ncbi:IS3 family transposase [Catenibacterium sp. co_0103]|nr:IS3 family transposase [Catenibacterium sp. co_0103]
MEGFWGILKCEIYHYGKKYETREELEAAIKRMDKILQS